MHCVNKTIMKKIIFINDLKYPQGDAGSIRVQNFATALQLIGEDVKVISHGNRIEYNNKIEYEYKNVPFTLFYNKNKFIDRISFIPKIIYWILKNKSDIKSVIGYGSSMPLVLSLKLICKVLNINFICDVTEWYSKEQFSNPFAITYIFKNILNKYILDKGVKIIAISYYLFDYFKNKGCNVVRIPIFCNLNDSKYITFRKKKHEKITFLYAGSPGKKDYLYNMLIGISQLEEEKLKNIRLIIAGINVYTLRTLIPEAAYEKIKNITEAKGRISHDEVISLYQISDFSLLLRDPQLRVSRAGFPSKVIESMSFKTPLICNYSSDLSHFLNKNNAIISKDYDPKSFREAIDYAVSLDSSEILKISENAFDTVQKSFCMESILNDLKNIIS